MGRWTAKGCQQSTSSSINVRAVGSTLLPDHGAKTGSQPSDQKLLEKDGSLGVFEPPPRGTDERTADGVAEEAETFIQASSLSAEQRSMWRSLSAAVADATPPPEETKKGPPSPEVLAAMQSARKAQDAFIAELPLAQREEVLQFIEMKKRERKLRSKEDVLRSKAEHIVKGGVRQQADLASAALKEKKKEVMERAFWLWQKDRQKQEGSSRIDSTEWKRIRAIGGENPTLGRYLKLAGWDACWQLPEPEGRLLRREGQDAALERYSQRKSQ